MLKYQTRYYVSHAVAISFITMFNFENKLLFLFITSFTFFSGKVMALLFVQKICPSVCLWIKRIHNPNLSVCSERSIPTCSSCQKEKLDYHTIVLSFHQLAVGLIVAAVI